MRAALADEPLMASAVRDVAVAPLLAPLAAPGLDSHQALGLDLILEGFLAHRGRPRILAPASRGRALVLGDYCYARGLVRIAAAGDLYAIAALSELIATATGRVADDPAPAGLAALWRATVAAIAGDESARRDLPAGRDAFAAGDPAPIEAVGATLGVPAELRLALEPPAPAESAA